MYYIHPDGTGLHEVLESEGGERVNHPWFSPDSKSIVFTSDEAGVPVEPISVPNQFQPYGDLFFSKADGTEVQRLTHNAYENGTPAWGCTFIPPHDLSGEGKKLSSQFDDSHFLKTEPKLVTPKSVCGQVKIKSHALCLDVLGVLLLMMGPWTSDECLDVHNTY